MITQQEIDQRIESFPALCRKSGLKVTPQRISVYSMLAATDSHPTPETIYTAIRPSLPSISLGTVYKILDLLNVKGLLRRVATADQAARYDARVDTHHHAVCSECGRIEDLDFDGQNGELNNVAPPPGFDFHQLELVMRGICGPCQN